MERADVYDTTGNLKCSEGAGRNDAEGICQIFRDSIADGRGMVYREKGNTGLFTPADVVPVGDRTQGKQSVTICPIPGGEVVFNRHTFSETYFCFTHIIG